MICVIILIIIIYRMSVLRNYDLCYHFIYDLLDMGITISDTSVCNVCNVCEHVKCISVAKW
jgi:hypothetical protein